MQTIAGSVTPFESTWAAGLSGKSLGPLKPWGLSLWKAKQGSNPEHQATVKELAKTSETHYPIRVELPMALTTDPSHPASLAWCLAFASVLRRLQKHSRSLGGEFTHGLLDPPEYQVIQVLFRPNLAVKAYYNANLGFHELSRPLPLRTPLLHSHATGHYPSGNQLLDQAAPTWANA